MENLTLLHIGPQHSTWVPAQYRKNRQKRRSTADTEQQVGHGVFVAKLGVSTEQPVGEKLRELPKDSGHAEQAENKRNMGNHVKWAEYTESRCVDRQAMEEERSGNAAKKVKGDVDIWKACEEV